MKTLGLMTVAGMALVSATGALPPIRGRMKAATGGWGGGYDTHSPYQPKVYYRERGRRSYKQEFRRGGCKIEREWDDGKYKEEVECDRAYRPPAYGYFYVYPN
ncbi:hypothetical protein QW131_29240 [Roseibium salinum]|nr:hypothetical protein [Roseibium salinum]